MEFSDALTITVLGLGVVFSGLLLTAALISSFSLIPRLLGRGSGTPATGDAGAVSSQEPPIPGDILAVITAVLEVERRLYHSDPGGRLTINRRHEEPQT
jgi:Na+-transporting methylmalonyl-CoA/oxaloacetate decarboxylase gamma subunit